MKSQLRLLPLALFFPAAALGGPSSVESPASQVGMPAAFTPAFDALSATYEFQNDLDLDDSSGSLDGSRFALTSFLSEPIAIGGDWTFLPAMEYSLTSLDFSDTPAGFPLGDEDLHKVGLHAMLYHSAPGSRWLYGGWGRASFASDTQGIDGDDFYFDVAATAAYMVTDRFMLGLGVAGLELGSDGYLVGGPGFYWKPTDEIDVNLIGTMFNAIWQPSEDWVLAFRVRPFGNSWNIDNDGSSQQLDLSSYTARLHLERRVYNDIWLSLGLGYAFANEIELRDSSNDKLFDDDLDGALSASIGLRVRTW
jgi:hypothetical protein